MPLFKAKTFFFTTLLSRRGLSSSSSSAIASTKKLPIIKCINRIHNDYKRIAIEEAQKALREYLHATKSLPFVFAELIANNSLFSLTSLFPKVRLSVKTFPASFRRILRYEPINEFEFFFESIGIDYCDVHRFLPPKTYFFSQDSTVLDAAIALSQFGFPWNMLGKLCVEDISIFGKSPIELTERLCVLKLRYGLDNLSVAGIILAFPHLLSLEGEFVADIDEIFYALKRAFLELDLESCVEGNVDAWYEVCSKFRVFYDLGCEKRRVMELIHEKKELFIKCSKEVFLEKVEYFCKFGVGKVDVGILILQSPELLSLELEKRAFSVAGFLVHFGLDGKELQRVTRKYTHVLGRNEMANLPYVMKALDLHEWCFDKIKSSNGRLLITYAMSFPDEGIDKEFVNAWKRIESSRCSFHMMAKMDFLKRVGFGENVLTVKILNRLFATDLQERFDCFLRLGFKHSKLCSMILRAPDILRQSSQRLEEKVKFVCEDMGSSLQFLVIWPKFLEFNLDTRIKRRLGVYVWLREKGLYTKYHSIPYMIKCNEKRFIGRLYEIHPAVPKHYFERCDDDWTFSKELLNPT